jgi:hypothetical protein
MGGSARSEARRRYQQTVERLLDAIAERRGRQLALAARGVRPAGMSDLDGELDRIRDELAAVIAAGSAGFDTRDTTEAAPARPRARPRRRAMPVPGAALPA